MENWYDDPKIMDEASQEWFDKPQIVAELQLDNTITPAKINTKGKSEVEMFADYIAEKEGFRSEAYLLKGEKNYTIGYGHNSPDVKKGQTITKEEAKELLLKDVESRVPELQNAFKDFNKFNLNLKQNLMSSWFRGSLVGSPNTRKLINAGKFKEAADEFLKHDEYKTAVENEKPGIRPRMEATAEALRNYVPN